MSIEVWQAARFDKVLEGGRTKPLVLECERQDEGGKWKSESFVVKSLGHPEVYVGSLFAEVAGNLLAREFDIATPRPVLVQLGADFITSVRDFLPSNIQLQVGYGVGVEYLSSLKPIVNDFKWTPTICSAATMIYAFDLLVNNPDRRREKPNCAQWGDSLLAYDFELCFSFLQALINPQPHEVSKCGIAHEHIFQKELLSQIRDWSPFENKLKLLNVSQFGSALQGIPSSWMSQQQRVLNHLLGAQNQQSLLVLELEKSLRVQK